MDLKHFSFHQKHLKHHEHEFNTRLFEEHFSVLLLVSLLTGCFVGLLVWIFFFFFSEGVQFFWVTLPSWGLDLIYLRPVLFFCGALLTGLAQLFWEGYPKGLHKIIQVNREEGSFGFSNIPAIFLTTMIPLWFGCAVGPEASLMSFIVTILCFTAGKLHIEDKFLQILNWVGISAGLGACFSAPLFGFMEMIEQPVSFDSSETIPFPNTKRIIIYLTAIFGAILSLRVSNYIYPVLSGMPRYITGSVSTEEYLYFLPVCLIASLTGLLYPLFTKLNRKFCSKLDNIFIKTFLCAILLCVIIPYFPLTQFSGEAQIESLMTSYLGYSAGYLFLTVVLKLFLVSFCIESGWRGGNLFPTVFSGICLGYSLSMFFPGIDTTFCLAVTSGALCGCILRKPMATALLLLLCFPIQMVVWMCAGAFIGSLFPAMIEHARDKRYERTFTR